MVRGEQRDSVGDVPLCVDEVAEVECKGAEGVGGSCLHERCEVGGDGVDMRVGADIDAIVRRGDDYCRYANAIVIRHRLLKARADLGAGAVEKTRQVVVGIAGRKEKK